MIRLTLLAALDPRSLRGLLRRARLVLCGALVGTAAVSAIAPRTSLVWHGVGALCGALLVIWGEIE